VAKGRLLSKVKVENGIKTFASYVTVDNRIIRDGAEIATRDTEEIFVVSNCSPNKVYLILVTFSTNDEDLPFPEHKVAGHMSRLDEHDAFSVML